MVFVVGSVHMENFVGCLFCNFGTLPICASAFQKWRKRYCIQERFPTPDGPHLYIYIYCDSPYLKQRTPTNWMLTLPWMGYDSLDHHSSKMQRQGFVGRLRWGLQTGQMVKIGARHDVVRSKCALPGTESLDAMGFLVSKIRNSMSLLQHYALLKESSSHY